MRVSLSIPHKLFKRAEAASKQMKVSRSRLYKAALAEYLQRLDDDAVTEKLNEVYSRVDSRLDEAFARAQWQVLARDPW